jgi:DNA-binding transcriptional MerR regulator
LQQILFYRELEFSLKEIAVILSRPDYDKTDALEKQRQLLLLKRRHLDELISLVEDTLGGVKMKDQPMTAAEIEAVKKQYAAEAKERWGNTEAYAESQEKHASYSEKQELTIAEKADHIFTAFAARRDSDPSDPEVQKLVQKWQDHITKYHYQCTDDILVGLGQMYVADERFQGNIDRYGDGTAQLISEAIAFYCKQKAE